MKMNEIREYAKGVGVQLISKLKTKKALIHAIQKSEGNNECFCNIFDCSITDCAWYDDCKVQ